MLTLVLSLQFAGCGDDDKPTKPKSLQPGSLTDPSYVAASFILDVANSSIESGYLMAVVNFWSIRWGSPSGPVYHPASGFWYVEDFYIDTVYSDENPSVIINTTDVILKDSVRFWHGNTAVQNPDSALLTRIESGLYASATADSTDDDMTIAHSLNITGAPGEIWSDGDVTVSGTGTMFGNTSEDYYLDPDAPSMDSLGVCSQTFNLAITYPNLAVNMDEIIFGCPTGGTVTTTGPLDVDYCPGAEENLEFPATWKSVMTFSGDNITVVTTSPTRQWTESGMCGDF